MWFALALDVSAWPIGVFAVSASAPLWFFIAGHLTTIGSPGKRLLVAMGLGRCW